MLGVAVDGVVVEGVAEGAEVVFAGGLVSGARCGMVLLTTGDAPGAAEGELYGVVGPCVTGDVVLFRGAG